MGGVLRLAVVPAIVLMATGCATKDWVKSLVGQKEAEIDQRVGTRVGAVEGRVGQQGEKVTAVIVAFCAIIAPGSYILFMLTTLLAVRRPPAPHWVGELLRWAHSMQPWSMLEVMILGILVALIKIAELATVEPGIGMYAVGGLVVLFAAIMITFDPREVWRRIEWTDDVAEAVR